MQVLTGSGSPTEFPQQWSFTSLTNQHLSILEQRRRIVKTINARFHIPLPSDCTYYYHRNNFFSDGTVRFDVY